MIPQAYEIEQYFDRLWPLMRSITGEGVRRTHDILGEIVPFERFEIPSGSQVFDWTVPKEWVLRQAYIVGPDGNRVVDVADNTLHIVNYSSPFHGTMDRAELDRHLYSLPELPDAIPYITSYYSSRWGFCLTQRQRDALPEGRYEVVVDTDFIDGALTLSEAVLPGETEQEVLISTYTCHPSMANNELSGPLVAAFLYRALAALPRRRLTYRFVFLPESIGSISYLSFRGDHLRANVVAGLVLSCIGDGGAYTFKATQRGDSLTDRALTYALKRWTAEPRFRPFDPGGSDEKHYSSPGFDLPVGVLGRTFFGEYAEYHTSLDNKSFLDFSAMAQSVAFLVRALRLLDRNQPYLCLQPFGEPCLGKRGLYPSVSPARNFTDDLMALKWLTNQSNGQRDLLSIAERSGLDFDLLADTCDTLVGAGVLAPATAGAAAL